MELLKPLQFISSLNRKKQDPGKFVFTGKTNVHETDIQRFDYDKDSCTETKNVPLEDIQKFEENGLNNAEVIASRTFYGCRRLFTIEIPLAR